MIRTELDYRVKPPDTQSIADITQPISVPTMETPLSGELGRTAISSLLRLVRRGIIFQTFENGLYTEDRLAYFRRGKDHLKAEIVTTQKQGQVEMIFELSEATLRGWGVYGRRLLNQGVLRSEQLEIDPDADQVLQFISDFKTAKPDYKATESALQESLYAAAHSGQEGLYRARWQR